MLNSSPTPRPDTLQPHDGRCSACPHRGVADDGRIVCAKISRGDNEVSPALCAACPAAQINCQHLRFTLEKSLASSIIVHYGNGKSEVWDDRPPAVHFNRAACLARVIPIVSNKECAAGCALHQPRYIAEDEMYRGQAAVAKAEEMPVSVPMPGKVIPFPAALAARR
jgi:hypothetical protein